MYLLLGNSPGEKKRRFKQNSLTSLLPPPEVLLFDTVTFFTTTLFTIFLCLQLNRARAMVPLMNYWLPVPEQLSNGVNSK